MIKIVFIIANKTSCTQHKIDKFVLSNLNITDSITE